MAGLFTGLGIARGAERLQQYEQTRPDRELQRETAQQRIDMGEQQLQEQKDTAPLRKSAMEVQVGLQQAQLKQAQAANLKTSTYSAFRLYEADGNVKHLNNFLTEAKKNPAGRANFGDVLRVDALTRTPETEAMLRAQGIVNPDEFFSDPEQVQNMVLSTGVDGSRELISMLAMYAGTGYTQHMTTEELANLTKRATLNKALRGPESAETSVISKIAEEENISTYAATKQYYAAKSKRSTSSGKARGGTKVERVADGLQYENPTMSRTEALEQATEITETRTAGMKDIDAANDIRKELDDSDFFEVDLTTPENRRKFGPKIAAIEKLADTELTNEDKRIVRQVRSLIKLGGTAGTAISEDEAGPLDYLLRSVKSYISNDIEGLEGVAAYETFRNVFRNAMYGVTLTKPEIQSFTAAAGSLKQQTGPVLQKLTVQVQDLKTQLESVRDMNDEYVTTYYLGKSVEEVDGIIESLEERLDMFKQYTGEDIKLNNVQLNSGEKRSLEDIFGAK